jgi:hypothetical protein
MDDINNNNNINNEVEQAQQHTILPQEQIDAADNYDARKRRRLHLISVLQKTDDFYLQTRNKIDVLVEEFLDETRDDIHNMLCDNTDPGSGEHYLGLDSDRDTEAEVETAIRFFPEVLSRRKEIDMKWDEDEDEIDEEGEIVHLVEDLYPIQLLGFTHREWPHIQCNWKTVSFIPLVARLSKEFGLFEVEARGGLVSPLSSPYDSNVLQNLMFSDGRGKLHYLFYYDDKHYESVDDKYLQVLIQLRQMDLLKKEDIQRYELLDRLCVSGHGCYFAENRFQFLVEWDPNALTRIRDCGRVQFNFAIYPFGATIRTFQLIFDAGIKYFPKQKGIHRLFRQGIRQGIRASGKTPFQFFCEKFGYEQVMKVIEETLIRYADTPINIVDALITAAIDENVHLECVYFLLRREPDVLQKLLSSTPAVVAVKSNNDYDDYAGNEGKDGGSNLLVAGPMNSSKKRKRM